MNNPVVELPFFAKLLILLLLARVFGEIFEYFGQPSMIGEILAGIFLGPSVFNIIHMNNELHVFGEMGVFLLVIRAGLEIRFDEVKRAIKGRNIWIALMGFLVPVASGIFIGWLFEMDVTVATYMSLCIAITALPVSIRILMDLKRLNTPIGRKIISVAIFNDVIALMILGVLLHVGDAEKSLLTNPLSDENDPLSYTNIALKIGQSLLYVLLFFAVILITNRILYNTAQKIDFFRDRLSKILNYLRGRESLFAIVFLFILVFATLSELVGLHFVVGAFFGAMLLNQEMLGKENFKQVEDTTSSITMGFLAPIFFAGIGLVFSISSISDIWLLTAVLVVSFGSKIVGGFIGARLAGMNNDEAITVGIGLNARGIMELVIANIALTSGKIDNSMFSILVLMGLLTTISTPFWLKIAFRRLDKTPSTAGKIQNREVT